ncbi:hypothetical protein DFP74_0522 [Nocardiopsis sp. Huas11]|nr:hypothetical protein DFP74_0522 [Nocardiopsis sp. Huas11]
MSAERAPRALSLHLATGAVRVLPPSEAAQLTASRRDRMLHLIPAGTRTRQELARLLFETDPLIGNVTRQYRVVRDPRTQRVVGRGLSSQGEQALAALVSRLSRD